MMHRIFSRDWNWSTAFNTLNVVLFENCSNLVLWFNNCDIRVIWQEKIEKSADFQEKENGSQNWICITDLTPDLYDKDKDKDKAKDKDKVKDKDQDKLRYLAPYRIAWLARYFTISRLEFNSIQWLLAPAFIIATINISGIEAILRLIWCIAIQGIYLPRTHVQLNSVEFGDDGKITTIIAEVLISGS